MVSITPLIMSDLVNMSKIRFISNRHQAHIFFHNILKQITIKENGEVVKYGKLQRDSTCNEVKENPEKPQKTSTGNRPEDKNQ